MRLWLSEAYFKMALNPRLKQGLLAVGPEEILCLRRGYLRARESETASILSLALKYPRQRLQFSRSRAAFLHLGDTINPQACPVYSFAAQPDVRSHA